MGPIVSEQMPIPAFYQKITSFRFRSTIYVVPAEKRRAAISAPNCIKAPQPIPVFRWNKMNAEL